MRVLTAGAPPAAATIQRVEDGLGWTVRQLYGLTETSPLMTFCEELPEHRQLDPEGQARQKARQGVEQITGGEVRVVDGDGVEVPADGQTQGEIVVRGNVVMRGYYNDPEATEQVMGDGWFHSGDAAVVHADGYIEIRDRLKDVIISGGENISSVEVEATLLRHDAVQEVAVVGMPDAKWGEAPHAFVVFRAGAEAPGDELRAFCRERLAHFKVPHSFTPVTELPKTATGKIQKYVLRKGRPNSPPSDRFDGSASKESRDDRPLACTPCRSSPALVARSRPSLAGPRPALQAKPGRDMAVAAPESVGVSTERLKRLDAGMQGLVTDGKLAGAVTLLTRHGKTVHVGVHGVKDIRTGAPMTRDAIFRIYSMTKPVTGVAMLMLYEEGKWRLDDPVSRFIPEFGKLKVWVGENPDGTPKVEAARRSMTMRELMTHSAGWPTAWSAATRSTSST